jgi:pyrroline-5-carboxylate reductase
LNIGILGIGNLGSSIIGGLVQSKLEGIKLYAYDKNKTNLIKYRDDRVYVAESEEELFNASDVLILAVKPTQIKGVLNKLPVSFSGKTIISAAAGISTDFIRENLHLINVKIFRIMTNLGCEFNVAPVLVAGDLPLDSGTQEAVAALGKHYQENEQQLESMTTKVCSGPALISYFLDSLVQYCKIVGLEGDSSREIVNMVALSTSYYLKYKKVSYEEFIEKVTTPGGITLKVLHNMDKMSVKGRIVDSLIRAGSTNRH